MSGKTETVFEDSKKLFENIAERWIADSTELKPSEIPETVYHYTNAAGLEGALRSGKIWLTDFRFLNDSAEFTQSVEIMKSVINERLEGEGYIISSFYKKILEYSNGGNAKNGYVFSLTSERDDLSQWRGYANEGMGFSIGLAGQDICERSREEFNFSKVVYDVDMERRSLEVSLKEMEVNLVKQIELDNDNRDKDIINQAALMFVNIASNRAPYNKHPSFFGENEWRIVTYREKNDDDIKVRVSGSRLVPYLEVDASNTRRLPLVSIGVGPGFAGSEVVDAVKSLAAMYGYSPEIYFANTPYRRQ